MSSKDLRNWTIRCILLCHCDIEKHGFQHVDWLFEGADIVTASRTAYGQGADAAHNQYGTAFVSACERMIII